MEFEDYLNAFKRIDKLLIASYICLAVGAIICFVAIFIPYPAFVYLLCIGFLFILGITGDIRYFIDKWRLK